MAHGFLPLSHAAKDVVLSAAFNPTGTHLATASADHRLRVFTLPASTPATSPDSPKQSDWTLLEAWRAHAGAALDARFCSTPAGEILASIGADLRLKIWREDPSQAPRSGRRFRLCYAQSSARGVGYASLDPAPPHPARDAVLALATRDGLVSLLEPAGAPDAATDGDGGNGGSSAGGAGLEDWRELDQFWACAGGAVERGRETRFRVAFQRTEEPCYGAVVAGVDARALSLCVTALDAVRVFRVVGGGWAGDGPYRVQAPVAELTGARGLVRDASWAPRAWAERDWIATAAADGFVRIYELWAVPGSAGAPEERAGREQAAGRGAARPQSGIGAGLAGASRAPGGDGGGLEPGQVAHEWKMMAEVAHEGVWKVEWIEGGKRSIHSCCGLGDPLIIPGAMLVSAGDSGTAHIWAQGQDGQWLEYADFGPDS